MAGLHETVRVGHGSVVRGATVEEHGIPAASIGSVDLEEVARVDPTAAAEIARISELLQQGNETVEEFLALVQLMHRVGYPEDAEYLLRRNLDWSEGEELYARLFGTTVPDEFHRAILALADEFGLNLRRSEELDFLDTVYDSVPRDRTTPRYNVLHHPSIIRIAYNRKNYMTAEVTTAERRDTIDAYDLTQIIFLRWQHGKWRLIDWRDA